jgi:hypothetical protein
MPETVGILLLEAAGYGGISGWTAFGIAGGVSAASIVGSTVLVGSLIAANALLAKKPEETTQDGQISVRQARAARRRNYGIVMLGGALMFSETLEGIRYQVIAVNHGEIDAFEDHWMADQLAAVPPGAGGPITNLYIAPDGGQCVHVYPLRGTDADPAYALLAVRFPAYWTLAHQGKGIAKVLTLTIQPEAKNFTKVYPGGQTPIYRTTARAVKVWDPRDLTQHKDLKDTWKWTQNPVLIALDFHRHSDGMGLASFDDVFFTPAALAEDWIPAAAICEEWSPIKAGGAELRYVCSGGYELPSPPKGVLNAILATCDGETYQRADGAIGIRVGKVVNPTVHITDKHILSYSNFVRGSAAGGLSPVNVITAKYTAKNLDFQEADADPWRDEDSIEEAGREASQNIDLTWVTSHAQARRLMKIAYKRLNPEWTVTIITDLDGLRAYGERFVKVTIDELLIESEPAEVVGFELNAGGSCSISLRQFNQSAYDWYPAIEEGTAPNQADTTSEGEEIDNPSGVGASVGSGVISVHWTASGRVDTTPVLQYRVNPAGPWQAGIVDTPTTGHTPALPAGIYDVQVQFTVGSQTSGWSPLLNINVT